jgi:NitT/TauT family transport system substrate-binding protein
VVILAGLHVGGFERVGTDHVRAIRALKGKTIAVPALGTSQHVYRSSMMT